MDLTYHTHLVLSHLYLLTFLVEHYKKKDFKPELGGLAGLQWDSAELYQVEKKQYISFIILCFFQTPNYISSSYNIQGSDKI